MLLKKQNNVSLLFITISPQRGLGGRERNLKIMILEPSYGLSYDRFLLSLLKAVTARCGAPRGAWMANRQVSLKIEDPS